MNPALITILIFGILLSVILITYGLKKKKEENAERLRQEEQVPFICFGQKIFLKRKEIPKFERATRDEKRRALNNFKSAVKRGDIMPVYEGGEIIGYIKSEK
jgi:hypothetical protein